MLPKKLFGLKNGENYMNFQYYCLLSFIYFNLFLFMTRETKNQLLTLAKKYLKTIKQYERCREIFDDELLL